MLEISIFKVRSEVSSTPIYRCCSLVPSPKSTYRIEAITEHQRFDAVPLLEIAAVNRILRLRSFPLSLFIQQVIFLGIEAHKPRFRPLHHGVKVMLQLYLIRGIDSSLQ